MNLIRIKGDMVPLLWSTISAHLEDAILMSNGDHTPGSVLVDVMNGEMQLWGVFTDDGECVAGVTTFLRQYQTGMVRCEIVHCGGEGVGDWIDLIDGIEDWARGQGCSGIRLIGRRGWARLLPSYAESAVVLEKRWPLIGARHAAHAQVMQ